MGYTHYWNTETWTALDSEGFKTVLPIVRDIVTRYRDLLCWECDQPERTPEVSERFIRFNGKGDDGHETFIFKPNDHGFCKTARKPYDLAVCEALLVLNAYIPNMQLSSDGFACNLPKKGDAPVPDGTWAEAAENVTRYGLHYAFEVTNERPPYADLEPVLLDDPGKNNLVKDELPKEKKPERCTHVYCGICGHKDVQLFRHLREQHGLDASDYAEKCPGAPLYAPAFGEFILRHKVRVENGTHKMDAALFNLSTTVDLLPREHVPALDDDYRFPEKHTKPLTQSLLADDRMLVVGHTGCGKSSLIMQLAARLNWPVSRVNLNGETSVSDFVGQWTVSNKTMEYAYGVLPTAMKEGRILLLEEIDAADPGVLFVLQNVLEENGTLVLTDKGGEVIRPHEKFRIVATANTLGLGDDTGLYTGTRVLNASHLDRWTVVYELDHLPKDEEAALLCAKVDSLSVEKADQLVSFAHALRQAFEEEELLTPFSTRRLLALAKAGTLYNDFDAALRTTVLNKLPKSDRITVAEIAQRFF